MSDLRAQLQVPRDHLGRPLPLGTQVFSGIAVLVAVVLPFTPVSRDVTILWAGLTVVIVASVASMRRRPQVRTRATRLGPVTEIAASWFRLVSIMALLAVLAGGAAVGAQRLLDDSPVLAGMAGLVAALFLWIALVQATAPDTRGVVHLSPLGLSYSGADRRAFVVWDDVAAVAAEEPRPVVRIALVPGTSVAAARIPGRLGRLQVGDPGVLTVLPHGMALLPTDLARVIAHYARAAGSRSELGTEAALMRIGMITAEPVMGYDLQLDIEQQPGAPGTSPAAVLPQGRRRLRAASVRESAVSATGVSWASVVIGAICLLAGAANVVSGWGDGYLVGRGTLNALIGVAIMASGMIRLRVIKQVSTDLLADLEPAEQRPGD